MVQWLRIHLSKQGTQVPIPGQATKIPHASGQLSLHPNYHACLRTRESVLRSKRNPWAAARKGLHAAVKTQSSPPPPKKKAERTATGAAGSWNMMTEHLPPSRMAHPQAGGGDASELCMPRGWCPANRPAPKPHRETTGYFPAWVSSHVDAEGLSAMTKWKMDNTHVSRG